MPLASVTDIVFASDSFWGNASLDVLRMLMSTSKTLRAELVIDFGTDKRIPRPQQPFERAMLAMKQSRPDAMNGWTIRLSNARYHFSLQVAAMVQLCVALPVGDRCRINEICDGRLSIYSYIINVNRGDIFGRMHFLDAYRLMVERPGGVKAAMERRHRFDAEVLASVESIVAKVGDRYERMDENVINVINKLSDELEEEERQKQQKALKKSIRELQNFSNHLYDTHINMKFHFDAKNMAAIPMPKTKHNIHRFSVVFNSSVAGYKDFNLKYPEVLTLDCLAGL